MTHVAFKRLIRSQFRNALVCTAVLVVIVTVWYQLFARYEIDGPTGGSNAAAYPREWTDPVTGMEFVLISPGSFRMGSPEDETGRESHENQHIVTLSRPFYMAKYEVTQRQWELVMGSNPSWFRESVPDAPLEQVSWMDAREFLDKLNRKSGSATGRFRLPTEAEWEYACRAGSETAYNTGRELTAAVANFDARHPRQPGSPAGPYVGYPTRGGTYPPNQWGLYDMHGNLWEWCEDDYCSYPDQAELVDAVGKCGTTIKIIRGGSWYFDANSARCAARYTHQQADKGFSLGFRVVRDADAPSTASPAKRPAVGNQHY